MTGRTHAALGAACGAALSLAGLPLVPAVVTGALGGLLPDCDVVGSRGTRTMLALGVAALAGSSVVPALRPVGAWPLVGLAAMLLIGMLTGHRGATHSLLAAGLVALGALWLDLPALALGYANHLLADALTPEGVPLLWPWRTARMRRPLVRTGGMGDFLIGLGGWLVVAATMLRGPR